MMPSRSLNKPITFRSAFMDSERSASATTDAGVMNNLASFKRLIDIITPTVSDYEQIMLKNRLVEYTVLVELNEESPDPELVKKINEIEIETVGDYPALSSDFEITSGPRGSLGKFATARRVGSAMETQTMQTGEFGELTPPRPTGAQKKEAQLEKLRTELKRKNPLTDPVGILDTIDSIAPSAEQTGYNTPRESQEASATSGIAREERELKRQYVHESGFPFPG
jgi:hypothetical protein